jgi:twitching motility protein PilJ
MHVPRRFSCTLILLVPCLFTACDVLPGGKARDALWQAEIDAMALAMHADAAAEGSLEAFDEMRASRQALDTALAAPAPEPAPPEVVAAWTKARELADAVASGQPAVLALADAESEFGSRIPQFVARLDEVQHLVVESEQARATPRQVYLLSRLMLLLDRMQRRAERIRFGGPDAISAADAFERDRTILERSLAGLLDGDAELQIEAIAQPEARKRLGEVREQLPEAIEVAQPLFAQLTATLEAREAADALPFAVEELRSQLQRARVRR